MCKSANAIIYVDLHKLITVDFDELSIYNQNKTLSIIFY